jgi:prepilin-type processing-associated H-X9-DG protein
MRRLAARHGKATDGGTEAMTNFAFFDGHVAMYPSKNYDMNNQPGTGTRTGWFNFKQETIGYINNQK